MGQKVRTMVGLMRERGMPGRLRSDTGPWVIAHARQGWLAGQGVRTHDVTPGSPWENDHFELLDLETGVVLVLLAA